MKRKSIDFLITPIIFLIVLGLFGSARGATLQDQINALLAQVAALQAQLAAQGAAAVSSGTVPASLLSAGDLTVGSRGSAVADLQDFLGVSPATGYFGSRTKAALAKWQAGHDISPATGYFGPKTRKALGDLAKPAPAVSASAPAISLPTSTPSAIVSQPTTMPAAAATSAPAVAALPNPFSSTLKFQVTSLNNFTLSSYGDKILEEFHVSAAAGEKTAITRIKFTNIGTFNNDYLINFRLVKASTGTVLAAVDHPVNGAIEFKVVSSPTLPDNGLAVSGNDYQVWAFILTPNYGEVKPNINLAIQSIGDISAADFNDLSRVADISQNNSFPILGPIITAF